MPGNIEIKGNVPQPTEATANKFYDAIAKSMDTEASAAADGVALQGKAFDFQKDAFWGGMIGNGVKDIFSGIMNWYMMSNMLDLQKNAQSLQEKVVDHKIALDNVVVEKQAELAEEKNTLALNLAETEANKQKAIARVNADAKVDIAKANAMSKAFAQYNYGKPSQPIAI